MRIKPKELARIKKRRKLWAIFGWGWAYKRTEGGREKTEYTDDPNQSKGIGFFRKNHSLNCGCVMCKWHTFEKRQRNKVARKRSKEDIHNQMKEL